MKLYKLNNVELSVSNRGNIYLFGKKLKQYNNGNNYFSVSVIGKLVYVHRIVCAAFNGESPIAGMDVNHLDGNTKNNKPNNLEWVTRSQNQKHAFSVLGRKHSRNQLGKSGFDHHFSKPVDKICPNTGKIIETFGSKELAAKSVGVDSSAIYNAITGRNRVKMCRGFKWRYNEIGNRYVSKYEYEKINGTVKRKLKNFDL